jgi:hypothetical protein
LGTKGAPSGENKKDYSGQSCSLCCDDDYHCYTTNQMFQIVPVLCYLEPFPPPYLDLFLFDPGFPYYLTPHLFGPCWFYFFPYFCYLGPFLLFGPLYFLRPATPLFYCMFGPRPLPYTVTTHKQQLRTASFHSPPFFLVCLARAHFLTPAQPTNSSFDHVFGSFSYLYCIAQIVQGSNNSAHTRLTAFILTPLRTLINAQEARNYFPTTKHPSRVHR